LFADQPGCLEPVQTGHADVQHYDVWFQALALLYGVDAIHGLATNLPFRGWFEESSKSAPENFVIIDD
jgi:hypothetical protein